MRPPRRQIGYQPKTGQPRNPDGTIQLKPIYADEWPGCLGKPADPKQ